ncbi:polysaccharide export outer membrane protein [Bradyrhizobium sp. AZCC 2262]|uniref:polysaccharide biosynthesis/export family protein n=1 Tax=Bradyrhizobium sp. AZCC 2262 TaxID=3117022 RepID=UPI002FF35E7D
MGFRLSCLGALAGALLSACSVMPVSGPQSWDIASGQTEIPYALVHLNSTNINILASNAPRIAGVFGDRRGPQTVVLGVGDTVGVTIFETGPGLFVPNDTGYVRPGNFITVPPQAVSVEGTITIPSAGVIRAKGSTVAGLQRDILAALKNRALEPNVVVTVLDQRWSNYTLLGDVRGSGRFPVSTGGERLLDAIGRAGGLLGSGNESWVVLDRNGKRAVAPFGALVDEAENNIYVRPQDTIYVFREPQTFLAFGASGRQGQFPFEAWRVSLSEAIAKATGLNDVNASPESVFIYRGESREVAQRLGIDVANFTGPVIPIIYQVNLRDPGGYFLTSKFQMRNKDVLYVSNAVSVEASKFLNYIRTIVATVQDPVNLGISGYALKAAINGTASNTAIVTTPVPIAGPVGP